MTAALLERLRWDAPEAERRAAIEEAVAAPEGLDLAALILPSAGKATFDGAAEILTRIGSPRIDPHLPALMRWLQDLNWPGARTVFGFLERMDPATLLPPFKAVVDQARAEGDGEWEWSLARLAEARGDLRADCEP